MNYENKWRTSRFSRGARVPYCVVCNDTGWVSISFFGQRPWTCTCGAGDPADEMIVHDVRCDSVACPFDQLLNTTGDSHEVPGGNLRHDRP